MDSGHPLRKAFKRGHWMQGAGDEMKRKGTEGSFTAAAQRAGMSTAALAAKDYSKPGAEGKRARFAYIAEHGRGK